MRQRDSNLADLIEERYARLPIEAIQEELRRDRVDVSGTLVAVDAILHRRTPRRRTGGFLKAAQIAVAGLGIAFLAGSNAVPPADLDQVRASSPVTRGGRYVETPHYRPPNLARAGNSGSDHAIERTLDVQTKLIAHSDQAHLRAIGPLTTLSACTSGQVSDPSVAFSYSLAYIGPAQHWDHPFTERQPAGAWAPFEVLGTREQISILHISTHGIATEPRAGPGCRSQ